MEDYIDRDEIKRILRDAYRTIESWASEEKIDEKIRWFWCHYDARDVVEEDGDIEGIVNAYYEGVYLTLDDVVDEQDPSKEWIKDLGKQIIDFYNGDWVF